MTKFRLKTTTMIFAALLLSALLICVFAACAPRTTDEVRTVTFMNGDDVYETQTVKLGEKYTFPQNDPTLEQPDDDHLYSFLGWTLDPDFYEYRSELLTEPDYVVSNITIYAAYRLVAIDSTPGQGADLVYNVEFRMPRGEDFGEWSGKTLEQFTQKEVHRYSDAVLPDAELLPQIDGYHFTGEWSGGSLTNVRGNRRVTAVYEKNVYNYTWNYLGQTYTRELPFRTQVDLTEHPQVDEAFVFDGWYTDPEFHTPATLTEIPAQDVELYAKYRVDFSTATVSYEGSLVYGDIRNNLYISGLKECDDLVYTFQWTVNDVVDEPSDVRFREVRNAGDYNVAVRIFAVYKGDVLRDEGDAATGQGSAQFVYTVDKATLTAVVTLSKNSIVYGDEIPEATIVYDGFVFDETAEGVGVGQDFLIMRGEQDCTDTNLHVGAYRVETHPRELPNYKFAQIAAPTFDVTKKDLTVTATVTSNVYGDGFDYQVAFDGFVEAYNDDEQVLGRHWFTLDGDGEYVFGDRIHAGEYSAQLCGYASDDYNVILPDAVTFGVSKRPASAEITAEGGIYGVTPDVSYKLDNVFAEDEDRFTPAYTYTSGGNAYNDISRFVVGNYNVTATFEERGYSDYQTVAVTGDEFEITKRPLNVTVDVQSVYTYGDTVTAKAVYENNFAFDEDENTNGLVRGEISFVWKNAEGTEYRRNNFEAGNYSVVAQGVSALNYEFRFPATQFVVNRKALVLKVHLQSDSILYGETPRVAADSGYINGIEYVGFAFDETATSVFGIAKLPQITYLDAENEATQNFHAGTYTATTSAESANYDIEVVAQSFTVNRRTLFVNVELSAPSLVYGNKPTSTIVYAAENYDGFFGNEKNIYATDAHVVYGGNQTYTQEQLNGTVKMLAGKYVVTVQGIDEGINKDYQVTYQYTVDNLTFTVERAPIQITVSAASDTYTYGVDPALTVATDKFGYGETAQELFGDGWDTVLYTKDGKPATIDGHFGAGEYHATLKDLSNDNYIITITPFDFTVNKADLTVTVSADGFKYGEQDSPVPTLKYQGFVFDENSEDLDGVARYSYARDNVLYEDSVFHAGKYAVTVAGYTSDNYEITYVGGEFDVQTRQITLTMGNGWTTYAQDPIAYNWYSIGGDEILGGENKELTFFVAITRNGDKYVQGSNKYFPHGDYVVTVTHSDNGDYTVTGDNTLTFTVAKLTYNLNVSGAKKWAERADWSATPRIPDSADRFTLQGSIVLNDPESVSAGDHSDNEIGKQFVWKNNEYHVYVGDEDVTDNFTFTYTLSVSLSNSDFAVQKPENLTFTFDGTVHTFAVTATADGISADQITITYDYDGKYSQSQVSIRDVREDNYVVYYTVHAQNAEDATGSFTVIVNKADINVTAPSNITKDYDKQDSFVALKQGTNFFGVEADDEFSATVKYSKDSKDYDQDSLSIVNVKDSGTVNFLVDAGVNYNTATGFYEVAINKATVRLPEIESKTYNGNKQTAGVVATEYYDVSDVGGIDADTYQVVLALKDADNYKWSDGNEEKTRKFDFVIARAQLTRPTADNAVYVYTAVEQTYSPDFGEQEVSLFKVDNNVQTNADSYNVTVAITDKINYEWTDGKQDDIEFTFVINKADINVTVPDDITENFNNTNRFAEVSATGVEGDDEFEPTVTYGRSDSLCDQPSLNLTNVADSGAVYFKVTAGDNYNEATGSYNVQINVAEPDIQDVTDSAEYTYRSGIVCKTQQDIYAAITQNAKNLYGDQTVEYQLNDGDFSATLSDIINAGSYTIKVKIFGDNYKEVTKTYTFTVKQRALTINAPSDISQKYNGETWNSQIAVDGLDVDDINTIAKVTYSYNPNNAYIAYSSNVAPSFTNATIGDLNVTVSVSLTDNNYSLGENGNFSGTYTVNISKAELTIPKASKEYTYDATEQNFNLDDNYDPSLMSMSGDVTGKNAQEYTMQVSLTEDAKVNYVWADSTNGIQNVSFVINRATLTRPTEDNTVYVYTAAEQTYSPDFGEQDVNLFDIVGNVRIDANEAGHEVTVSIHDKVNYEWTDSTQDDVSFSFVILRKTINAPKAADITYTYNGEEQEFKFVEGSFDSSTMKVSNNKQRIANEKGYVVQVTLSDPANYKWQDGAVTEFTFVILRKSVEKPSTPAEVYRYTGAKLTFTPTNFNASYMSISNNVQTEVGEYNVIVNLSDLVNYVWIDGTQYAVGLQFVINKGIAPAPAQQDITLETEVGMFLNIKLGDVDLNVLKPGYYWDWSKNNQETPVVSGKNTFKAYYNPDVTRYENSTVEVTVTFNTRKEKITVYTDSVFEGDFGISSATLSTDQIKSFNAFGENGRTFTEEEINFIKDKITVNETSGNTIVFTVGGTYIAKFSIVLAENDYYEIDGVAELSAVFKLKSVDVNGKLYTIEDALQVANSGDVVTVKHHTVFASGQVAEIAGYSVANGNYTVKEGVKLFLPYDGVNGEHATTTAITSILGNSAQEAKFMKLELALPEGVVLFNEGQITIGGTTTGGSGGNSTGAGQTSGDYAQIKLGKDAGIESRGDIQAWGFIKEETPNNGSYVTMRSGNIIMPFIVIEHRGGSKFIGMLPSLTTGSPFNRLFMQNITATFTVNYGATVTGFANLYANSHDNQTAINLIGGNSSYLLNVQKGTYVVAKYDIQTKVTNLKVYGGFEFNSMSLNVAGASISTEQVLFPISWYWQIELFPLQEGGSANVDITKQGIKLLPGSSLTIGKGVTVTASRIAVYDVFNDINYAATPYQNDNHNDPARLTVNGTLNVESFKIGGKNVCGLGGAVYTEEDGAVLNVATASVDSYEINGSGEWIKTNYQLQLKLITGGVVDSDFTAVGAGTYESEKGGWKNADTSTQYGIDYQYVFVNDTVGGEKDIQNVNPATYTLAADVILKNATLDGWVFLGWFSDVSCNEEYRLDTIQATWRSDVTVYGLFKQVNSFVFNYTTNDGAISIESDMVLDSELDSFDLADKHFNEIGVYDDDLTQTKYFDGWYLDSTYDTPYSVEAVRAKGMGVNTPITLYAKWGTKSKLNVKITEVDVTINSVKYSSDTTLYFKAGKVISIILTPQDSALSNGSIKSVEIVGTEYSGSFTDRQGSYSFTMPDQDVTATIKGKAGGFCIVEGTLITLADGTQKKVEDLLPADKVLVFNHYTGKYEACELWSNIHAGNEAAWYVITYLYFSDGTKFGITYEHGLFDKTLNKYVYFNSDNANEFIGHKFVKVGNVNGQFVSGEVTLLGWENVTEYVRVYSPTSVFIMDIVTNDLLSITAWPTNSDGFTNIFAYDDNMKINSEAMQADIEQFDLYTYEDFKGLMDETVFNALPWKYLKVAVGKGQITWEEILYTIDWIYTQGQIQLN